MTNDYPALLAIRNELAEIPLGADWHYDTIEKLPDYWRGYFNCFIDALGDSVESEDEEFRQEILARMDACWSRK